MKTTRFVLLITMTCLAMSCRQPNARPVAKEVPQAKTSESAMVTTLKTMGVPAAVYTKNGDFMLVVDRDLEEGTITAECPFSHNLSDFDIEGFAEKVDRVAAWDDPELNTVLRYAFEKGTTRIKPIPSSHRPPPGP